MVTERFGVEVLDKLPSSAQVRAGRALLGWSQDRLAEASGTSRRTIASLELGAQVSVNTLHAVKTAIEEAGIEFVGEGLSEGVRRCASY